MGLLDWPGNLSEGGERVSDGERSSRKSGSSEKFPKTAKEPHLKTEEFILTATGEHGEEVVVKTRCVRRESMDCRDRYHDRNQVMYVERVKVNNPSQKKQEERQPSKSNSHRCRAHLLLGFRGSSSRSAIRSN
mmetsp:Transcript_10591/g.15330  ORF Transcript_10591/g.15330 Transcript_10591/m.15330 type:complete len:133 (-) Transcript_10591:134-532(-)|eukprot:CAMPEP_0184749218 /NCGR_PEP_ID=MMETSP0315-20130426/26542_1 /TAXON_ID=101924 /ORGANISM="Rhodosorus marinus, Strain UTEX LB 2760" /LENGTH=132 /DNA_ID=CAMNT_0027225921 /DNA_START=28 /DNA_END=426 /DNA_ORIENTATION=+